MKEKLDIIIPFYSKDIEDVSVLVDFIHFLGDVYGNVILIYTGVEQHRTDRLSLEFINSKIKLFSDDILIDIPYSEMETIRTESNFKDLKHYYHITTCTFEYILRHRNSIQKGEGFIWLERDMMPMSFSWCKLIYQKWVECNRPYI